MYMLKLICHMFAVKEIAGDVVLFAPQIEPSCSTISNLQSEIHT